jgi:hypothetical protein
MAAGNATTQALLNSMRVTNQVQEVGVSNPPNMANVSVNLLQAASPQLFNLGANTRIDTTLSDRQESQCRSYEGIGGLRRLARETAGRSALETGCGWVYKPSAGVNPDVNQASFGNNKGPLNRALQAGERWYWDLDRAEKDISVAQCQKAGKCSQLALLGRQAEFCGFCKSTGAMIPVENGAARYSQDPNFSCGPADIVTASRGSCGAAGFHDMTSGFGGSRHEGFAASVSLDDLENCKPPLTRDCVIMAARVAGCSDAGTLISALQAAPGGGDYDRELKSKAAFVAYKETANPGLTQAMLKDGSTALTTALDDFGGLKKNMESANKKLAQASRDLCLLGGEYDPYSFCAEMMNPTMQISQTNFPCVLREWGNQGGTDKGTAYPTLAAWQGKTVMSFLNFISELKKGLQSDDKRVNADAIEKFIGVSSFVNTVATLPKSDAIRGAENVWILFDAGNANMTPIIARYDQRMAAGGEVVPSFPNWQTLQGKWRIQHWNIGLISAFEYRPKNSQQVQFQVVTDDGFMIGLNQNPFENTGYRSYDWGSWRYQPPTRYTSSPYTMWGENDNQKNVVVMKWFQGGGEAAFDWKMIVKEGSAAPKTITPSESYADRMDMYLTQEPLAPWIQYEVCTRPNKGAGNQTGFFEKRWNGQFAITWQNVPMYSFDIESKNLIFQTDPQRRQDVPGKKPYMSLVANSSWNTTSRVAFTAFKTLTLLVRPVANLPNQAVVSIFQHANFSGFGWGIHLKNNNGQYTFSYWNGAAWVEIPAFANEWNLIVIQYVNTESGLRSINVSSERLAALQSDQQISKFLENLKARQSSFAGGFLVGSPLADRNNAGHFVIGGRGDSAAFRNAQGQNTWAVQSFTGDVAWIHGFNQYFMTVDVLKAEVKQNWLSRWPRGGLE